MILIFLLYALTSTTFVLGKAALSYLSAPLFLVAARMIVCGGLLLGCYRIIRGPILIRKAAWGLFACIAFFHIFLAYTAEFWALQYVSSPKAALFYNLSPMCMALLAFAVRGDRITRMQCVGIVIAFAGLLPLIAEQQGVEALVGGLGRLSFPEIALLISVFSSCYGWILVKEVTDKWAYHPFIINGISMVLGGLVAGILSWFVEFPLRFICPSALSIHPIEQKVIAVLGCSWGPPLIFGGYVLVLMLIANVIFYNVYTVLLKHYSLTLLSLCGSVSPLFTVLFAAWWRAEQVSSIFFFSFAVVLTGIIIFYREELSRNKIGPSLQ